MNVFAPMWSDSSTWNRGPMPSPRSVEEGRASVIVSTSGERFTQCSEISRLCRSGWYPLKPRSAAGPIFLASVSAWLSAIPSVPSLSFSSFFIGKDWGFTS
jgi:hypothetical protein